MAGYTDDTLYDVCVYLTSAEKTVNVIAVESVKNTCTAVDPSYSYTGMAVADMYRSSELWPK